MPWCPKCRYEYNDGFTKCSDCGAVLVDELDLSSKEQKRAQEGKPLEKVQRSSEDYDEVFLINTDNAVELSYITSMFKDEEIKYRIADESSGGYLQILHGKSFFGKNIFVDKESYDKAIEILQSLEDFQMMSEKQTEIDYGKRKKYTLVKIIIWGFLGPSFLGILFGIIYLIIDILK